MPAKASETPAPVVVSPETPRRTRSLWLPIALIVLVLAVILLFLLIVHKSLPPGFVTQTFKNNGYTYSVAVSKHASQVSKNNYVYLQNVTNDSKQKATFVIEQGATKSLQNCAAIGNGLKPAFTFTTKDSKEVNYACQSQNKTYIGAIKVGPSQHLMSLNVTGSGTIDKATAKSIFESVRVTGTLGHTGKAVTKDQVNFPKNQKVTPLPTKFP